MAAPETSPPAAAPPVRPLVEPGPVLFVGSIGLLAILGLVISMFRHPGTPAEVALDYSRVAGGVLVPDVKEADPNALTSALESRQPGLAARVPDLTAAGYHLRGGAVHEMAGQPGVVAVYHNDLQDLLVWHAYRGQVTDLPETSDVRKHEGRRYYVHRKSADILVFWQDGPRVLVITSSLPVEQVVKIAYQATAS
jgi:anti-sigma factor RsiW